MLNNKTSASNIHRKTEKRVKNLSPRSPLKVKNLNISSSLSASSCSSSFSSVTSISSDAAAAAASKGCLRFFLSHHSSTLTKNRKPKSLTANKTPKSGTTVKPLRGKKLSENGGNLLENGGNLKNPEKPSSRNVNRLKKNPPPCLYSWKSGKKLGTRSDLSVNSVVELGEKGVNFTPESKIGDGSDLGEKGVNCYDDSSPIPPIQASVSPEIQGGSTSVVKATPNTCYAAGHVMSGVSDKRKCRPRGLLTIGDNDLFGSSRTKVFISEDEYVIERFNKPRVSLVPCLAEASMQWLLSPCDERSEDKDDGHDKSGLRLNECDVLMSPYSIGCSSSPSSSLGFSSELCDKSNCTITTSEATTVSHSGRTRSRSSDFRGVLGPSFDHFVHSPSPSSPPCVPNSKVEVSPKQDKYQHDYESEATPHSEVSTGSGNVIQTPQSDSSSESFGLSHMSRDEISRLWFESELDSVAEVLRRVSLSPECEIPMVDSPRMSFEFNPLIRPDKSIDLANFRKAMESQASPGIPESLFCNFPKSEVRISWREGLTSRIFEMDEVDCCRCFSDEEDDDVNGCNDQSGSPSEVADTDSNKILDKACDTTRLVHNEDIISQEDEKSSLSKGTICPCADSSNGGESSDQIAKDSSWKVCFENHLFQV